MSLSTGVLPYLQVHKRMQRNMAARAMGPEMGIMRNFHKRKAARRGEHYYGVELLSLEARCLADT
jgi:hypothetical protein